VKLFGPFIELIGEQLIRLKMGEESKVMDVIDEVDLRSNGKLRDTLIESATGSIRPIYKVLLNGRDIDFVNALNTRLSEGDTVSIIPPSAGG
jgi:molybdopterin synthase sulfur carrier subunit